MKKKELIEFRVQQNDGNVLSFSINKEELERLYNEAVKSASVICFTLTNGMKATITKEQAKFALDSLEVVKTNIVIPKCLASFVQELTTNPKFLTTERISARDEELEKLYSCLTSANKPNCILVGESGVGKTAVVNELVRQIVTKECPNHLKKYRLIEIHSDKLIDSYYVCAKSKKGLKKFEGIIKLLYAFVSKYRKNIILFFDDAFYTRCQIELMDFFEFCIKSRVKTISAVNDEDFQEYFYEDIDIMKYLNPIVIEEPDINDIYDIIKGSIEVMKHGYKVEMSEKMINFAILTGYHLSSSNSANPQSTLDVIDFALADAKRKGQKEVNKRNILAYYYIDFKLEKKTSVEEKTITAYHEAGHYIVDRYVTHIKDSRNSFVSILPIEGALGLTASHTERGMQLTYDKEYYIDEIASYLGGRVGEELITKTYSSGASSDLTYASSIAESVILESGLSDYEENKNKSYMIGGYLKDYLLTDEEKTRINKEISSLLSKGFQRAQEIINEHQKTLETIVEKLLEDGILTGDELDEICQNS